MVIPSERKVGKCVGVFKWVYGCSEHNWGSAGKEEAENRCWIDNTLSTIDYIIAEVTSLSEGL